MAEVELDITKELDHEKCDRLAELVEELTTSGSETLDPDTIKELKKICKQSDNYVKLTYCQASSQLEKEHAEIRLSAFQIINELFVRSHCMRDLFLQDFQEVMDLTLETDPSRPLPPPKPAAKKLKEEVTLAIQKWQDKFGAHYKKLALGYNYLKTCKKVNFAAGVAETLAEQRRAQLLREKQQKQIQKQLENALAELAESKQEIRNSLLQVESCLRLILPDPEEFSFPDLLSPDPDPTESQSKKETNSEPKSSPSEDGKPRKENKNNNSDKSDSEIKHMNRDSKKDSSNDREKDASSHKQKDKHKHKDHESRSDCHKSRSEKDRNKSRSNEKTSKEKSHESRSKSDHKSRSHEKSSTERSHEHSSSSKRSHSERKSGESRSDHSKSRSSKESSHSSRSKEKRSSKDSRSEKRRDSKSASDSDRSRSRHHRSRSEKDISRSKPIEEKDTSKTNIKIEPNTANGSNKSESSKKDSEPTESSRKRSVNDEPSETDSSSKRVKTAMEINTIKESTDLKEESENVTDIPNHSSPEPPCENNSVPSNTEEYVMDTNTHSKMFNPETAVLDCQDDIRDVAVKVEGVDKNDGNTAMDSQEDDVKGVKDDIDVSAYSGAKENACMDCLGDDIKESNAIEGKTSSNSDTKDSKDVKESDRSNDKCSDSNADEIKDVKNPKENDAHDSKTCADSHDDDIKNPKEEDDTEDDDLEDQEPDYSDEEFEAGYVRHRGLGGQQFSVNIEVRPDVLSIKETEDNADVLNVLRDTVALIDNKFLPAIQKWMMAFTKAASQENIRKALDLKEMVETARKRIMKLEIMGKNGQSKTILDEDEDSDFEEVPDAPITNPALAATVLKKKTSLVEPQDQVAEKIPLTNKSWSLSERVKDGEELDPTSYAAAVKLAEAREMQEMKPSTSQQPQPSTSSGHLDPEAERRRQELLRAAPKVPYNMDLSHWGQEIETPLMVRYDSEHRFWTPNSTDEDRVDQSALSAMTSRVMTYTGEFEPVKWACRAPLPSGKLCPRMDRHKCPFHGKIIARDPMGNPTDPKDIAELEKLQEKKQQEETPEWEDPDLQREIAAATGVDVSRQAKGKGKNPKKKKGNLTNIKKTLDTGRRRLEKKVFNPGAMARAANALDKVDAKKVRDKFGDQFHYSLK